MLKTVHQKLKHALTGGHWVWHCQDPYLLKWFHQVQSSLKSQLDKLQRVQNVAARLVSGVRKPDHISPTLKALHWLPIEKQIIFKILLMTYKTLNGLAPSYLTTLITRYHPTCNPAHCNPAH